MRETVFLNTDREMPLLGLGVYKTADNEAETAITAAVNAGYRLIDTASAYKNEESVGKAIAKCGVPRKELFITSKIWNNAQRLGDVDGAFYRSMERLKLDYLDLYLTILLIWLQSSPAEIPALLLHELSLIDPVNLKSSPKAALY